MEINKMTTYPIQPLRPAKTAASFAASRSRLPTLQSIKTGLLKEFHPVYRQGRMVELALNEAEALAHDTGFPLLVFPALAREKVEAVAAWNRRQRMVRRRVLSFAA
jgi:hypothetical protein